MEFISCSVFSLGSASALQESIWFYVLFFESQILLFSMALKKTTEEIFITDISASDPVGFELLETLQHFSRKSVVRILFVLASSY